MMEGRSQWGTQSGSSALECGRHPTPCPVFQRKWFLVDYDTVSREAESLFDWPIYIRMEKVRQEKYWLMAEGRVLLADRSFLELDKENSHRHTGL